MKRYKILYISGSLGLGHITRDIAVGIQLRKLMPEVEIEWLATHPATLVLKESGEKLVQGCEQYSNENISAENVARGSNLNLLSYLIKSRKQWKNNVELFLNLIKTNHYDMIIGDETYEINLALRKHKVLKNFPFVMIFDFVGLEPMTKNPLEWLGVFYWNKVWSHDYRKKIKPPYDLALFVGELEDVPDISFGFGLPNRRDFAKTMYNFVGYIFPFEVFNYSNRFEVRRKLGYGNEPIVICSIGGTAIGKELLENCGKAYNIAKERISDLHFIIVAGPRLNADSLKLPKDIDLFGYLPNLYEHFAACDLAIVQGGATSTLELTALRRPFFYFPIDGHCEQENVARILTKHGSGIRLSLKSTNPQTLADKILEGIGTEVSYPEIPTDGAKKAANLIIKLLNK